MHYARPPGQSLERSIPAIEHSGRYLCPGKNRELPKAEMTRTREQEANENRSPNEPRFVEAHRDRSSTNREASRQSDKESLPRHIHSSARDTCPVPASTPSPAGTNRLQSAPHTAKERWYGSDN